MFNQGGLSFEQAPPISVVLRFFISASIFGLLLGILLLFGSLDMVPLSEYTFSLSVVHLLALGVMTSFMLGAMFQMLPVLAGVVIKMPTEKAMITHILLILGVFSQIGSFYTLSSPLYLLTAILLGGGLLHASTLMVKELIRIEDHSSSSKGMLFALVSLISAISLGIIMLLSLGGYIDGGYFAHIREAHHSFALFGWVFLLIVSISFQVIEMFYVTPKYPNIMSRYLVLGTFSLLLIKTVMLFMMVDTAIVDIIISLLSVGYGGVTIQRLYRRRRPTSDATVWFWRLGMGMLILSSSITVLDNMVGLDMAYNRISNISFVGFGLSIVFAMVYKIVPFLVWFHLSNQGCMEAPMMHDVIHPKRAKIHFWIHLSVTLLSLLNTVIYTPIIEILSYLLFSISFGWLLYHIIGANRLYYRYSGVSE